MRSPQILIIDDNQYLLDTISHILKREGFSHDTTTSPGEGMEWIEEKDYDLVISDMRMPEMTGLELIKMVKVYRPETEVIFITGFGSIDSSVKELIARAIHQRSKRHNKRFLAINTSSLPETLLESELFGYKKGAFTGATQDRMGLIETTEGGSVFLDEVSSMSKAFQGKLLRVIQESEIIPVGGSESIPIDVRFISASNRNLKELVLEGVFREDLFYRLNVIEISIPPLRERPDDIILLAEHFLRKFCEEQAVPSKKFSRNMLKILYSHDWPGNVRELENTVRRAVIMSDTKMLTSKDIIIRRLDRSRMNAMRGIRNLLSMKYDEAKEQVTESFQKEYITNLLDSSRGNISRAAEKAGITRQALYRLIKKHTIPIPKQHAPQIQ